MAGNIIVLACACIINGICLIIYGIRLNKVERKLYDQQEDMKEMAEVIRYIVFERKG